MQLLEFPRDCTGIANSILNHIKNDLITLRTEKEKEDASRHSLQEIDHKEINKEKYILGF